MVTYDDEPSLVEASRRGDAEAFAALVMRYQKMIHALTFRMSGSEADAADLAQETFLQAWRHLDGFRGDAKFSSWLYRVAVNTSLNWAKREHRRQEIQQEFSDQPAASVTGDERLSRRVQEALLKLPAKQRAAVVLTAYDGLNHAQAARALGCSEATVSWRVFAARRKLRQWLRDLSRVTEGRA
jgi:RNA polymerase sigma-70 factor (ECF subfamily)